MGFKIKKMKKEEQVLYCAIIPIDGKKNYEHVVSACKKMGLPFKKKGRGYREIVVYYNRDMELYYLGANVVAEANGLFKSTLTT